MFEEEITAYRQEIEKLADEISSTESDSGSDEYPQATRSQAIMNLRSVHSKATSSMGSDDQMVAFGAKGLSPEMRMKHLLAGGGHGMVGKQFSAPGQGQTLTRFNSRKQAMSLQSPPSTLQTSVSLLPGQSGRAVSLPVKCPPQSEIFPSSETAPLQSHDVTSQSQNFGAWSPSSARQKKKKHRSQLRKSISLQPTEFLPIMNEEGRGGSGKHSSRHSRRSKRKKREREMAMGEDIDEEDEYADEGDNMSSAKRQKKGKKEKNPDRQAKKYKRKLKASLINNTKLKFELLNKERKLDMAEDEIKHLNERLIKMDERLKEMDEIVELQKKKIDSKKPEVTSCELSPVPITCVLCT